MANSNLPLYLDLKPDNILLDWGDTKDGPTVTRVIVSDLDSALDLKGAWSVRPKEGYKHVRFGNVRCRAPKMQTGLGIGLFSDVFSYALVVSLAEQCTVPLSKTKISIRKRKTITFILTLSAFISTFIP